MSLDARVAVLSGALNSIGRATALRLARDRAIDYVNSRCTSGAAQFVRDKIKSSEMTRLTCELITPGPEASGPDIIVPSTNPEIKVCDTDCLASPACGSRSCASGR